MTRTKLFFVELAGLAFLVPLIYYWLSIPEASTAQLLWSLATGLLAVALVAFLLALPLLRDWRQALRRTHWLCFFVFGFLLWVALCLWCEPYLQSLSRWLASWLTSLVRMPIAPDFFSRRVLSAETFALVSFIAVAPVAVWLAHGRRGRWAHSFAYWGKGLAFLLAGCAAPLWIFTWVPKLAGPTPELLSFTARILLALGLAAAAWIWFAQVAHQEALGDPDLTAANRPPEL